MSDMQTPTGRYFLILPDNQIAALSRLDTKTSDATDEAAAETFEPVRRSFMQSVKAALADAMSWRGEPQA